jgi:hypothetical protein
MKGMTSLFGCRVLNAAVTRDRRGLGGRPEEQ